jgi:hypothetical protein
MISGVYARKNYQNKVWAKHFSFNVDGGEMWETCKEKGVL